MSKLRVLVLCHDVVGKNVAGPGIRYQNVARVLGQRFDVALGVFSDKNRADKDILVVDPDSTAFHKIFDEYDIIFAQWLSQPMINYAGKTGKIIVFDLYAPVPIEYLANLEFSKKPLAKKQKEEFEAIVQMYKDYLARGQFFTCSNERQRDFWAGYLTASNLYGPEDFKRGKIYDKFLLCPMGIDPTPPKSTNLKLRKSVKGIDKDDFVLLWTGGIWDWFDAQLIVRAMAKLKDRSIKLVFLGTKHPNPIYEEEMGESLAARQLAGELGLLDKTIFFLDGWIPYAERGAYFKDANAAIYADKESLETRFSHRTRVLDHFWAGLPTICSSGDYISDVIDRSGLGIVVAERSPQAFAEAIQELKDSNKIYKDIQSNIKAQATQFSWEHTMEPLVEHLEALDAASLKRQIMKQHEVFSKQKRLPLKRRIRRSAKILLLGQ